MKIRLFSTGRRGFAAISAYIALMFGTLEQTPRLIRWLMGRGDLKMIIAAAFIAAGAFVIGLSWNSGMRNRVSYWLSVAAGAFTYYYVATHTSALAERLHLIVYGLLAAQIFSLMRFRLNGVRLFLLSGAVTSAIGLADEIAQHFLPGRYFGWGDVFINTAGGVLALVFIRYMFGDAGEAVEQP